VRHLSLSQEDVARSGTGDVNEDESYRQIGKRPSRRLEVRLIFLRFNHFHHSMSSYTLMVYFYYFLPPPRGVVVICVCWLMVQLLMFLCDARRM